MKRKIEYTSRYLCIHLNIFFLLTIVLPAFYNPAFASLDGLFNLADGEFRKAGYIGLEGRYFIQQPKQDGQSDYPFDPSLSLEPELSYTWDDDSDTILVKPFLRLASDAYDPDRTHFDVRELYWLHNAETWSFKCGLIKEFWGVTESRHLVDIINQTDFVDGANPDDKLGQPAAHFVYRSDYGALNAYLMPYFREGTFPSRKGRLRGVYPVDVDQPVYESDDKMHHTDFAFRYFHVLGNVDLGLSYFQGTGREPRVTLGTDEKGHTVLIPNYDLIKQASIDMQYTWDAWLFKLEAYRRYGHITDYNAFVAGLEYTSFGVGESNTDVGFLLESIYDGREWGDPPTTFNRELYTGIRVSLNDAADTTFLAGVTFDTDTWSQTFTGNFKTRFFEHYVLKIEWSFFGGVDEEEMVLKAMEKDSNIKIKYNYYF